MQGHEQVHCRAPDTEKVRYCKGSCFIKLFKPFSLSIVSLFAPLTKWRQQVPANNLKSVPLLFFLAQCGDVTNRALLVLGRIRKQENFEDTPS